MPKKLVLLLALLMLLTEIPSCSFTGLSPQNLMSPPKANADQQSIYRLLQGAQADVTFVYPRNGEYLSAITMHDFTGDGVEDAIGFHLVEDGGVGGIEVQFLTKENGVWRTLSSFRNPFSQVDRVCFANAPGGGQVVLVGWGSTRGDTGRIAVVNAYVYDGRGALEEYQLGNYAEMLLTDFDGNGVDELFTIDKFVATEAEGEESTPAMARVYAFDLEKPYELASTQADNSLTGYTLVQSGQLNARTKGVIVDGSVNAVTTSTQIFTLDGVRLRNFPGGVNTSEYTNPFSRPSLSTSPISSQDINGDGYFEFPAVTKLPGIPENVELYSTSYLVEWQGLTPEMESRVVLRALMNTQENYWFRLPYLLQGKVCAINDPKLRTVTYTEVIEDEEGSQLLGGTLFSIRVFTRSAWENRGETSGYSMILAQNDLVYGIQVVTRNENYRRCIEEITRNFQLLAG